MTPGDAELLERVARGEQGALADLYDRHAGWMLVRLGRRCSDRGLVEEALQDTFVSVWRTAGSFRAVDGAAGAGGWLWTLAARRLADLQRRGARETPVVSGLDGVSPGPEELLMAGLAHGELAGALTRLTPDLRRVLQVTVIDGLSTREAALVLGIPEGTVKTRAARARRQLRAGLT